MARKILTLTLNPSIDSACEAEEVFPVHKVRTFNERYDPGGGGINVARVIRELAGEAVAIYLAGGFTGAAFEEMIDAIGLQHQRIPIAGNTRISHVVYERTSGKEYRFVAQGPHVFEAEWQACLDVIRQAEAEYLVASGSLPRGIPADFYGRVAGIARDKGMRLVLDTSGEALRHALEQGVFLAKPNLRELQSLLGQPLETEEAQEAAVSELVQSGRTEMLAVSLGADGALLATRCGVTRLRSPRVRPRSAVGAGDSFVAAMVLGLAEGRPTRDAFALAVASGTAAVMTKGTELCRREDVERIYQRLVEEQAR